MRKIYQDGVVDNRIFPNYIELMESTNLPSLESTPLQDRFMAAIKKKLKSPEAVAIHYNDPHKGREGDEIFSVIDSKDGKTHLVIRAVSQEGGINLIGTERYDFIEVMWFDESNNECGQIQVIKRRDHPYESGIAIVDPEDIKFFIDTGGMTIDAAKGEVSMEKIEMLTQILESGQPNQILIDNAFQYLEETWEAEKKIRPNSNQSPQIT